MEEQPTPKWKTQLMIVGSIVGALVGVGAVYLYIRSVEAEQGGQALAPRSVKPTAMVSVGLTVLGLLKQIAGLGLEE